MEHQVRGLEEQLFNMQKNFREIQRDLGKPYLCYGSNISNLVLTLSPNYYKTSFGSS